MFTKKSYLLPKTFLIALVLSQSLVLDAAADKAAKEYSLKAALLYQFSRFISWPEESINQSGKFNVCVMGNDPFGKGLDGLKKRKYKDHQIIVSFPSNKSEASACHILYLVDPDCDLCRDLKTPVLMVSSQEGFIEKGGAIEFIRHQGNIRFSINADAIKEKKIKASAKLFEVALKVVGDASN